MQRSILAVVLCVLAFLFAFEAKLAGYSPAGDASSQVSAAKALRVDAPTLVPHGASAPGRVSTRAAFSAVAILVSFCASTSETAPRPNSLSSHIPVFLPVYLLSAIDSRPPPVSIS
jgi:hypothetical protein